MAFNLGDFASLTLDSSVPPAITKKEYVQNNNTYPIPASGLYWSWDTASTYYVKTIKIYVNSAVKRVDYSLTKGSSYFTFTPTNSSGYTTATSSGVVTIGTVNTKANNRSGSDNTGVIKVTVHTKTSLPDNSDDFRVIEIPLTQSYYVPTYSGGGSS
jgi:hypothetical protein